MKTSLFGTPLPVADRGNIVLVCGGRGFLDQMRLFKRMDRLHRAHRFTAVVEGQAPGADELAGDWARMRGLPLVEFPANWSGEGRAAGHSRNARQHDWTRPRLVVHFPGGPGTANMVQYAARSGTALHGVRPAAPKGIHWFVGTNEFLSNFFEWPVLYEDVLWPSSEHAFMSRKEDSQAYRDRVLAAPSPAAAKKVGKSARLVKGWDGKLRERVMAEVIDAKFSMPVMEARLQRTRGLPLVEANYWHDNTWGDCRCGPCAHIKGSNKLGRILMERRG